MDLTNLIAVWELEEASGTRNDAHSTNHLTDNNTVTSTTGKVGTCASFAVASSEYLSLTDNAALSIGGTDFSIAAWVQGATAMIDGSAIVYKGDGFGNRSYYLNTFFAGAGFQFEFKVLDSSAGTDQVAAATFGSLSVGTWYFVAATYVVSSKTLSISVNAGSQDQTAGIKTTFDDTGVFRVGADDSVFGYFNGLIDQVVFFKRALTTLEITALYNGGAGLSYSAMVGGGVLRGSSSFPALGAQ